MTSWAEVISEVVVLVAACKQDSRTGAAEAEADLNRLVTEEVRGPSVVATASLAVVHKPRATLNKMKVEALSRVRALQSRGAVCSLKSHLQLQASQFTSAICPTQLTKISCVVHLRSSARYCMLVSVLMSEANLVASALSSTTAGMLQTKQPSQ